MISEPNTTKLVPLGRIDRDSRREQVEPQNYLKATNLRVGIRDGEQGAQFLVHGNTAYDLPTYPFGVGFITGTRECVGAFSDEDSGYVYYWIKSSTGRNGVCRLNPDTGENIVLTAGTHINLPGDATVSSAVLIGNRFLVWTACEVPTDTISGAAPQWLDLHRTDPDRIREYILQAGNPVVQGEYRYRLWGPDNTQILNETLITVSGPGQAPQPFYALIGLQLGNRTTEISDFYYDGQSLRVVMNPGYKLDIVTPTGAFFYPLNGYPTEFLETAFDLVAWPPRYAPTVCHVVRSEVEYNYVFGKALQFRIRYNYRSGAVSAWGPVSAVSNQVDSFGDVDEARNAVEVNYTSDILQSESGRSLIESVDIAFREGSSESVQPWRLVDTIRVEDMDFAGDLTYDFFYDRQYSVVPSDGSGATPDTQVLKLFDRVPRVAAACAEIVDEDGNSILALGGCLEGGDAPNAARVTWSIDTVASPTGDEDQGAACQITIRGRVLSSDKAAAKWETNIHDLSGGPNGFVVYLAGTPYYGITDNFLDEATGFFEIKNVPRGQYIMRIASPLCRFDDTRGRRFNIERDEWQLTSAPVVNMPGAPGESELFIDLTTYQDPVYDISNQPAIIQDFSRTDETPPQYQIEGYLVDTEGAFTTDAERLTGIGVANQVVRGEARESAVLGGSGNTIPGSAFEVRTDHNGYFYHVYTHTSAVQFGGFRINDIRATNPCAGTTATYAVDTVYSGFIPGTVDRYSIYRALELNASVEQINPNGFVVGNPSVYCTIESAAFRANHSEVIQGQIDNLVPDPVENAYVVVAGEGRTDLTGSDGLYSIRLFNPEGNTVSTFDFDRLIVGAIRDRCYDKPPTPDPAPFTMNFCAGAQTQDFTMDIVPGEWIADIDKFRNLKSGGRYVTRVVYEDRANRKGAVVAQPDIYIPFHTEDGEGYTRRWVYYELNGKPPEWATHYRFLRSSDGVYRSYQNRTVQEVRYVNILAPDAAPIDTTFGSVDVTHILLRVDDYGNPEDQTDNPVFFFAREETGAKVEAAFRDFVRLVLDNSQTPVSNDSILEAEVVGFHVDADGDYFLVVDAAPFESLEVLPNFLIEIYSPRRSGDSLLYEMAEAFPILDAGTENRRHAGLLQDQSADGTIPARGYLRTGDTYWRRRLFEVVGGTTNYVLVTEDQSPTDREFADLDDRGRANPDQSFPERFFWNRIRTSETYLNAGSIVGINAFRALDTQAVDQAFGAIVALPVIGNRMIAVCRHRLQPIYVAFEAVVDLTGNALVGRTDRLLNLGPESLANYGCQHPHSLVIVGGSLFGVDLLRGDAWRYGQNGLQPISAGIRGDLLDASGDQRCVAALDPLYEEVLTHINANGDLVRAFREANGGFTSEYTFAPEMLVSHRRNLLSFKSGTAYLHNQSDSSNFYESAIFGQLKVVTAADGVHADKRYHNVRLVASSTTELPTIEVFRAREQTPMRSRLLKARFVQKGHARMAKFLRDMDDPNFDDTQQALFRGRPLFGHYIELTLEDDNGLWVAAVDVETTPLMDTKN